MATTPAVGTAEYEALLEETGRDDLDGFNYAAHLAATQGADSAVDEADSAIDTDNIESSNTVDDLTTDDQSTGMSPEVAALSDEEREDLYSQVGDLIYNPDWNLAAHIGGNIDDNGVFVAPSLDSGGSNEAASIDWANWADENGVDIARYQNDSLGYLPGFDQSDDWKEDLLSLPDEGSIEYENLLIETGRTSLEGFNFAAHVAAITSQTILTDLSEDDVYELIAETGRSDFADFDLDAHRASKEVILESVLTVFGQDFADPRGETVTADTLIIGSADPDFVDLTASSSLKKVVSTGEGDDTILANDLDNLIMSGSGNDEVDGGYGTDTLVLNASFSELTMQKVDDDKWSLSTATEGVDTVKNIERIILEDQAVALDIEGPDSAGAAYRIYNAAFSRAPDTEGLGYWINDVDAGASLEQIAQGFIDSDEFSSTYGSTVENDVFIDLLYQNVLGRDSDSAGKEYWLADMDAGLSRAGVLSSFSESVENQINVASQINNGIVYDLWVG